jgi:hypothetical protein
MVYVVSRLGGYIGGMGLLYTIEWVDVRTVEHTVSKVAICCNS